MFCPTILKKNASKAWSAAPAAQKSQMLLSGVVLIDGQSLDAVSESLPVEAGQTVQVIRVQGRRLVVRPVDEDTAAASSADPLKQSYDDPFDLPNA